ncbi:hypothetical protein THAOC_24585, partial [Thalassiosira oceanica]
SRDKGDRRPSSGRSSSRGRNKRTQSFHAGTRSTSVRSRGARSEGGGKAQAAAAAAAVKKSSSSSRHTSGTQPESLSSDEYLRRNRSRDERDDGGGGGGAGARRDEEEEGAPKGRGRREARPERPVRRHRGRVGVHQAHDDDRRVRGREVEVLVGQLELERRGVVLLVRRERRQGRRRGRRGRRRPRHDEVDQVGSRRDGREGQGDERDQGDEGIGDEGHGQDDGGEGCVRPQGEGEEVAERAVHAGVLGAERRHRRISLTPQPRHLPRELVRPPPLRGRVPEQGLDVPPPDEGVEGAEPRPPVVERGVDVVYRGVEPGVPAGHVHAEPGEEAGHQSDVEVGVGRDVEGTAEAVSEEDLIPPLRPDVHGRSVVEPVVIELQEGPEGLMDAGHVQPQVAQGVVRVVHALVVDVILPKEERVQAAPALRQVSGHGLARGPPGAGPVEVQILETRQLRHIEHEPIPVEGPAPEEFVPAEVQLGQPDVFQIAILVYARRHAGGVEINIQGLTIPVTVGSHDTGDDVTLSYGAYRGFRNRERVVAPALPREHHDGALLPLFHRRPFPLQAEQMPREEQHPVPAQAVVRAAAPRLRQRDRVLRLLALPRTHCGVATLRRSTSSRGLERRPRFFGSQFQANSDSSTITHSKLCRRGEDLDVWVYCVSDVIGPRDWRHRYRRGSGRSGAGLQN